MFVRYCSPFLPMFLRCLMLMLSGPVELLFLLPIGFDFLFITFLLQEC